MANNVQKHEGTQLETTRDNRPGQVEQFVQPRASVYEHEDSVILELEMPGVARDKIDVTVERDELTVTGWRQQEDLSGLEILHRERIPLHYRRSFVLSDRINTGAIGASCNDGVLRLTLPKSEGAKPRKIAIE
jgi:HSP20 family protein